MAALDDELLKDAESDARAVAYIRTQLPQELKDKFTDDVLYYFLDVLVEYYADSDILDQQPDEEGYIDIDMERIACHLAEKAHKEGIGEFSCDDLLFVVQGEMDFQESEADED